ncbi:MAG: hypothetical protein GF399_10665 [Candidatus Coatesbacteria bacterium]|nr:hypothetical protein [Candidatus Coatesbacteria bacterium]
MDTETRYGTEGWKEFLSNKDRLVNALKESIRATQSRPTSTDRGHTAEDKFREFLIDFLPDKFGVCKGFILPPYPTRKNYTLYEYDVIIYDKYNSPSLLGKADEQGRRHIPSNFVYCVLEIKSSFNKNSIILTFNKLQKLDKIRNTLHPNFVSTSVYYKLLDKDLDYYSLLDIYNSHIIGSHFIGSLILYCPAIDNELTGKISINYSRKENKRIIKPLAKNIENGKWATKITEVEGQERIMIGFSMRTNENDARIINGPDKLNVCFAYTVFSESIYVEDNYKSASLAWSYNEFPIFLFDLIRRMEGTYDGKIPSYHCLSFPKESDPEEFDFPSDDE